MKDNILGFEIALDGSKVRLHLPHGAYIRECRQLGRGAVVRMGARSRAYGSPDPVWAEPDEDLSTHDQVPLIPFYFVERTLKVIPSKDIQDERVLNLDHCEYPWALVWDWYGDTDWLLFSQSGHTRHDAVYYKA